MFYVMNIVNYLFLFLIVDDMMSLLLLIFLISISCFVFDVNIYVLNIRHFCFFLVFTDDDDDDVAVIVNILDLYFFVL